MRWEDIRLLVQVLSLILLAIILVQSSSLVNRLDGRDQAEINELSAQIIANHRRIANLEAQLMVAQSELESVDKRSANNKTNIRVHNRMHEGGEYVESNEREESGEPPPQQRDD